MKDFRGVFVFLAGAVVLSSTLAGEKLSCGVIIGADARNTGAHELKTHLELITGGKMRFGDLPCPGECAYRFEPSCLDGNSDACEWTWSETNVVFRGNTKYAVVDFLENGLGVRWPGGSDISYVPTNRIVSAVTHGVWRPSMRIRVIRGAHAESPRTRVENSTFRLRMRHGGHDQPTYGHAFPTWWERYGKDHRDYFAMRTDGLRGPINAKPDELQGDIAVYAANTHTSLGMCVTSTGLLAQVIANWKEEGMPKCINVCENDVPGTGSCHCPDCVAIDVVPAEIDTRYEYHHADRYVWFGNRVLAEARKFRPDVSICYYAYNGSRDAPGRERPEPGTIVGMVPTDFREGKVEAYVDAWKKAGLGEFFYRPNRHWYYTAEFIPMGGERYFCDIFEHLVAAGSIGFDYDALCVEPGSFAWYERYILYHAMQDPSKSMSHWEVHYFSAYGAADRFVHDYYRFWQREKWAKTLTRNKEEILRRGRFGNFGRGLVWDLERYYSEDDYLKAEEYVRAAEAVELPAPQAALVRKFRMQHEHAKLHYRAVASRNEDNARALLEFRRANGITEQTWCERYFGDPTGIGALLRGKKIIGNRSLLR